MPKGSERMPKGAMNLNCWKPLKPLLLNYDGNIIMAKIKLGYSDNIKDTRKCRVMGNQHPKFPNLVKDKRKDLGSTTIIFRSEISNQYL
jgi:hypothetical protein